MKRISMACSFSVVLIALLSLTSNAVCRSEDLLRPGGGRLLVVAPHPDDETLACGGLIQRVRALGGDVRVVYLTAGDGCITVNPISLINAQRIRRRIGTRRMEEAVAAMARFGVGRSELIFLGYPDRGLISLWQLRYGSGREYRSRMTGADHVFYTGLGSRGLPYDRGSLTQSLISVIASYKPEIIAFPVAWDRHPDHRATHYFVKTVLQQTMSNPRMVEFLVHSPQGPDRYKIPPGFNGHLETLFLVPGEVASKRWAIRAYRSQLPGLNRSLPAFARQEEPFFCEESAEIITVLKPAQEITEATAQTRYDWD